MQIRNHVYTALAGVMVMGMIMGHAAAQISPPLVPYAQQMPGVVPPLMQRPYAPYGAPLPSDYYPPEAKGNYLFPSYGLPRGYPLASNGNRFGSHNMP